MPSDPDSPMRAGGDLGRPKVFSARATVAVKPPAAWAGGAPSVKAAPAVAAAAQALANRRPDLAEDMLRAHLDAYPRDVSALRLLGEIATRVNRLGDAEDLFAHALSIDPGFLEARYNLAVVLSRQSKTIEALQEVARLRAARPADPLYRALEASVRDSIGDHAQSLKLYEDLFAEGLSGPRLLLSYGSLLKTLGRADEGAAVFRRLIASDHPEDKALLGEAWWSLSNLKIKPLDARDRQAMQSALQDPATSQEGRLHLHYALAKALDDAGEPAAAFRHYSAGAAMRRRDAGYDPDKQSGQVRQATRAFTPELMAAHRRSGCPAPDPIFVVGLPRAGSTLVDQILSSHPQVEGTMELVDLSALANRAGGWSYDGYIQALGRLTAGDVRALGEAYISRTRVYRKTQRPCFIDKMPQNWLYAGLITLILPNAKIIDIRRHPLAAGVSAFKQLFAAGHNYTYDFDDLGRYYREYVGFMDHIDAIAPGAVHRIIYEDLVEDTEAQVRRLLDYCGLTFDPACLSFHENRRPIRTPSAEQVRRPIYRDGLDQWRSWEPHLGPLKAALGDALEAWRGLAP